MLQTYVVLDFETTGFSPQINEIIQFGAIKFDENHRELARFNQLVKPQRSSLSPELSALTGILPSDLVDRPLINAVLPDFLIFISGNLIVAHNASFDLSFLYQAVIDCRIREAEHFEVVDTLTEARRLLKRKSYKLESFKSELGMSLRSHDALNDCLITAKLYQKLLELELPKKVARNEQLDLFADEDAEAVTEAIRRQLSLPITKDLLYFRWDSRQHWQKFDITSLSVEGQYSNGFSVKVKLLQNKEEILIHSDFLREMQKAGFIEEMGTVRE